jgi:hypothetical protein
MIEAALVIITILAIPVLAGLAGAMGVAIYLQMHNKRTSKNDH